MVITTNDTRKFIEDFECPLYIYGAGRIGYRVAWFLIKCGIEVNGFLDRNIEVDSEKKRSIMVEEILLPIESPTFLQTLNQHVRVISAIADPEKVINSIFELYSNSVNSSNIILLTPYNNDFIHGDKRIDFNTMLSYFRAKLVRKELPSILSNSCNAGMIYNMLGERVIFKSPTINTHIGPKDFIKICKEPRKYLSKDISFSHYGLYNGQKTIIGRIDDVFVYFLHGDDENQEYQRALKRWNRLRKAVDYDNLAFVMEETYEREPITYKEAKDYCEIKNKHLLLLRTRMFGELNNTICINHNNFRERGIVVEEWFDLLGWINE
ncbi:DUF1919 domain-containing protein [Butyrivibrio sp. LC3010]|uniref:DUF1919 domain-containing protein n=1 Tax=Butyrivibrio sp. LC3010 TaxID=1280680 RepID=UPI00041088A5|nr:DUF1919 domain-containing protein [Butyrivibrio sp. LC3010]